MLVRHCTIALWFLHVFLYFVTWKFWVDFDEFSTFEFLMTFRCKMHNQNSGRSNSNNIQKWDNSSIKAHKLSHILIRPIFFYNSYLKAVLINLLEERTMFLN